MLHEGRFSGKQHKANTEKDLNILAPKFGTILIPRMSFPHLHSHNVTDPNRRLLTLRKRCWCIAPHIRPQSYLQWKRDWVNDSSQLDSSHDIWWLGLDLSHVEKNGEPRWKKWWLDSTGVTVNDSRLESRVIFTKSLSSWRTNPRLHTKK